MASIKIINIELAMQEPEVLAEVLQKALQWPGETGISVLAHKRKPNGWLEWGMRVKFASSDSAMTVGVINRYPNATTEFHT